MTTTNNKGYFGEYGGAFAPETLVEPLRELDAAFQRVCREKGDSERFWSDFHRLLEKFAGRPTPLMFAQRLSEALDREVFIKREDLLHTGAHKINNALGQALLARAMGKPRLIAETGAGQHGVATATVAARLGMECVVYMGEVDMQRQHLNVVRMRMLGAEVRAVKTGRRTLKDAIGEAMRDWVARVEDTHYLLGSALGPHPYPTMVSEFQRVIGDEVRADLRLDDSDRPGTAPHAAFACVGGGSNALGLFLPLLDERTILVGVEAGGRGPALGEHAARFSGGRVGVLHGTRTLLLQDEHGQVAPTHSVSAGLDYPAVSPILADLGACGRVRFITASDDEALAAFFLLSRAEGIIPALESAHALAGLVRLKDELPKGARVVVNLSGRGDKDVETVARLTGEERRGS